MTSHSELDHTPAWADGGDHEPADYEADAAPFPSIQEQFVTVGFDLADDEIFDGGDDDGDGWEDDGDQPDDSDYSHGWDDGYTYAENNLFGMFTKKRLIESGKNWLSWRVRDLGWKLKALRRKFPRPSSDSDIPF